MKYKCLLTGVILLICLNACKKDSKNPAPSATIVAKWFMAKQSSGLYYNGSQISSFVDTTYTPVDFVEYHNDGTGYFSKHSSNGPSLAEFTYTLKGTVLTRFDGPLNSGVPETITTLTANSLSIHVSYTIADPNNTNQSDTEVDDLTYKR